MTADSRYERKVAKEGLYHQAFFGQQATPEEARRLRRLWKEAQREATKAGETRRDRRWS